MIRNRSFTLLAGGLSLLALSACDDARPEGALGPAQPPGTAAGLVSAPGDGAADFEEFEICKFGSGATFTVSTSSSLGTSGPTDVTLAEDECRVVAEPDETGGGSTVTTTVTVTEQVPSGFDLDHVDVTVRTGSGTTGPTSVAGPTVTEDIGGSAASVGLRGVLAEFHNVPEAGGGEGCTPGFWKNHTGAWTGASSGDLFTSVGFTDAWSPARPEKKVDPSTMTLLEGVELRGGGVNALARHAVAAWLNASHPGVDSDLSPSEVVSLFNSAVGGDVEAAKDELEGFNEQGCPLGAADF